MDVFFRTTRYVAAVATFALSQYVFAENYHWIPRGADWDVRFDSPQAACDWHSQQSAVTYFKFEVLISANQAACAQYSRENHNRWGTAFAYRYGDSCKEGETYNPTTGECSKDPEKGKSADLCAVPPPSSGPGVLKGNPVNFSNGNKFQVERDYSVGKLAFYRAYNGLDGLWRHAYSTRLRINGFAVALVHADGRESFFTLSGTAITPSPTERGSLARQEEGWVYRSANNEVFHFDSEGRLTRRESAVERIDLSYLNDKIQVADEFGNQLEISVRPDGQPLTLSGPLLQVTYTYDEENRLVALSRTLGGQSESRQYHYEDATHPRLLTAITDERGVRYASWSYDAQGRAISSEHAGGADRVSIDYNADGSSTVTNALGKQTTYRFQSIHGLKRITAIEGEPSANCPSSNSTFTYDARGLLTSKVDNKGNRTTYSYNARGLEISRTEAAGTA